MKKKTITRYVGIDAETAAELGELLTEASEKYAQFKPSVVWDLEHGHSAFLVFDEVTMIAESLREEYELRGECYTCEDCPHRIPETDGRKKYPWKCNRRPRGTVLDMPACNHVYMELEGEQ